MRLIWPRKALRFRLRDARSIGYVRGFENVHFETRTFETGVEYLAWLDGWRAGQRDRKRRIEREARKPAAIERELRAMWQRDWRVA